MLIQEDIIFIFGGIEDVTKEKNDIFAHKIGSNCWK